MWKSLANSVVVGLGATAIALVLGTMAAFAVQRYRFFGREVVSLLVVLPITLPGIVTGIALNATFTSALGVTLGMATVIIGHATFCIVIVFNNTQARLRRLGASLEDASADLGASPVADVPVRDVPDDARRTRRRRDTGVRAQLRRDRGDDVHRGTDGADAADLDLRKPVPAQSGTGHQRGRRGPDPGRDHPGVAGPALRRRPRDDAGVSYGYPWLPTVRRHHPGGVVGYGRHHVPLQPLSSRWVTTAMPRSR